MSKSASGPIVILNNDEARRYAGQALLIDIHDPDEMLGTCTALCLTRPGRVPSKLMRPVLFDVERRGRFHGWAPAGLGEIFVDLQTDVRPGGRYPSIKARKIGLWRVAMMTTLREPRAMLQTCRLLFTRNIRGFRYQFARLYESLNRPSYEAWLNAMRDRDEMSDRLSIKPGSEPLVLVSIVGNRERADATIRSIARQSYKNVLEVTADTVMAIKDQMPNADFWIRLPAGAQLDQRAIELLMQPLIADPDVAGVYCDEDRINANGVLSSPFFKPAWNPPLAATGWLVPDGAVIRLNSIGHDIDLNQTESGNLLLEAAKRGKVAHVPRVLFHRNLSFAPASASLPMRPKAKTNVSVIIPTRDHAELLGACLSGLFERTRFDNLDVIVVDNDSRQQETLELFAEYERDDLINRVKLPGPFNFSRACNLGIAHARHELVLLLNNDVEPLGPEWLDQLVAELDDPDIGAAGALLFFPDGFVQHAGVTLGSGSVARHTFQFCKPGDEKVIGLIDQRQEVSAVTAACLLTRRGLWDAVGGMSEDRLPVAFNDVDYCLKLRELGMGIMWTPHSRLIHRESVSRGRDDTPEKLARFAAEEAYMHERWGKIITNDPFYNPNLSLTVGDYSLDVAPRDLSPRFARATNPSAKNNMISHSETSFK